MKNFNLTEEHIRLSLKALSNYIKVDTDLLLKGFEAINHKAIFLVCDPCLLVHYYKHQCHFRLCGQCQYSQQWRYFYRLEPNVVGVKPSNVIILNLEGPIIPLSKLTYTDGVSLRDTLTETLALKEYKHILNGGLRILHYRINDELTKITPVIRAFLELKTHNSTFDMDTIRERWAATYGKTVSVNCKQPYGDSNKQLVAQLKTFCEPLGQHHPPLERLMKKADWKVNNHYSYPLNKHLTTYARNLLFVLVGHLSTVLKRQEFTYTSKPWRHIAKPREKFRCEQCRGDVRWSDIDPSEDFTKLKQYWNPTDDFEHITGEPDTMELELTLDEWEAQISVS